MSTPASCLEPLSKQSPDFSLVLGGPLFQFWRRTHLCGDALELLHRRILVLVLVSWAPLLALSLAEGHAWAGSVALPFLLDVDMHARLLLALPILVAAELLAHRRVRPIVRSFVDGGLVPDAARARFDAAVASAMRLRNSITAEVLLIAIVYVVGVGFVWRTQAALDVTSWYGGRADGRLQPSLAGWWWGLVSLPWFQFLLLRWYFRLAIWARFLWQVSRIELACRPTHPDRSGGLGFLALVADAFAPLMLAQGVMLAGLIADRIFFAGARLPDFQLELVGLVGLMLLAILGPLLVFFPRLAAVKRAGLCEYGALGQRYVGEFDRKWLGGAPAGGEPLLGSADVQSLADLGNSFAIVDGMRWTPFGWQTALQLAAITLLPILPLALTMFSLRELLERLVQVVF